MTLRWRRDPSWWLNGRTSTIGCAGGFLIGGGIAWALLWLYRRRSCQPHHDLSSLSDTAITAVPSSAATSIGLRLLVPKEIPTGVISLDGPGAAAAARGLLVTTLVVVGHNPAATGHWHVAADGTTTGPACPSPAGSVCWTPAPPPTYSP